MTFIEKNIINIKNVSPIKKEILEILFSHAIITNNKLILLKQKF